MPAKWRAGVLVKHESDCGWICLISPWLRLCRKVTGMAPFLSLNDGVETRVFKTGKIVIEKGSMLSLNVFMQERSYSGGWLEGMWKDMDPAARIPEFYFLSATRHNS